MLLEKLATKACKLDSRVISHAIFPFVCPATGGHDVLTKHAAAIPLLLTTSGGSGSSQSYTESHPGLIHRDAITRSPRRAAP